MVEEPTMAQQLRKKCINHVSKRLETALLKGRNQIGAEKNEIKQMRGFEDVLGRGKLRPWDW